MIKINKSTMVLMNWESIKGQHSLNEEEPALCMACAGAPVYSVECKKADHAKSQIKHASHVWDAPEEAKRVSQIQREFHKKLCEGAFSPRQGVYLTAASVAQIDLKINELKAEIAKENAEFKVCRIYTDFDVFEIDPATTSQHSVASAQKKIEGSISKTIEALKNADLSAVKAVVKETKNLAQLLDPESKKKVTELTQFTSRAAVWLKDASDSDEPEAIVKVTKDVQEGAARFASIFADLNVDAESAAA